MTTFQKIDVGEQLFRYLHEQQDLTKLLSSRTDEDGQPVVAIHRGNVPQFDQMIAECLTEDGQLQVRYDFQIDDFLVFELRDETYEPCISGGRSNPDEVLFDVQVVSDSMTSAIAIKHALQNAIDKLNGACEENQCDQIKPQKMCELYVCEARITGASEQNQKLTSASEFGLTAFDFDLSISPQWSQ